MYSGVSGGIPGGACLLVSSARLDSHVTGMMTVFRFLECGRSQDLGNGVTDRECRAEPFTCNENVFGYAAGAAAGGSSIRFKKRAWQP
jgi:hypothetical protein